MMLDGLDVSVYQAATPDLAGQAFLFARATYGTAIDGKYAMHVANARAAGLVTGAYHFGRSANAAPAATQAVVFLGAAGDVDLYVLDLESDSGSVGMTNAEAAEFIAAVQAAGKRCGLYHSESGFPQLGQDWNWVAKWSANPPVVPWDFWQYQGSPLDSDRFNGDAAALAALIRGDKMATLSWKPTGPQPTPGTTVDFLPGHDLLSTSDPVNLRYPQPSGVPHCSVIAIGEFRQIADGATVDVDGNPAQPTDPRVPVYILDGALPDGTPFGVVAAALVADCGPLQVPVIVDPLQAALDAANTKIKAAQEALA